MVVLLVGGVVEAWLVVVVVVDVVVVETGYRIDVSGIDGGVIFSIMVMEWCRK